MVGPGGLEPPTSRLSGVCSNQLSYRPLKRSAQTQSPPFLLSKGGEVAVECAIAPQPLRSGCGVYGKRNEDGGVSHLFSISDASIDRETVWRCILRKEVIQPQVPLRLPCYDFPPVADPTVVGCLHCWLAHRLRVKPTPMV